MATRPPKMNDPVVSSVVLEYAQGIMDMRFLDGSARAVLTMSDEKTIHTFQWFHDEITYTEQDFVGKTMDQIREMHRERDMRYLST